MADCLSIWYQRPDSNRHGQLARGILSPLCLPIPPLRQTNIGGDTRIRTGDEDFADPCLTAWRCRQKKWSGKRGSNPRHLPWQGSALPLSYSRTFIPDGQYFRDYSNVNKNRLFFGKNICRKAVELIAGIEVTV